MSRYYAYARAAAAVLIVGALSTTCRENQGLKSLTEPTHSPPASFATAPAPVTLVGAGDIGNCAGTGDEQTAALLDSVPGTVFTAGDDVYENGTDAEFANCYNPSWGRHKARTKPSLGNHEYQTAGATGYFNYFGAAAGEPGKGYYSYELGDWHVIVLNSNISMSAGSTQETWLKADLAANPKLCTLAYWHHPLYGSTSGSGTGGIVLSSIQPLWNDLYAAGADLVVNGHWHFYERQAPQKPDRTADPVFGIREIIAGMGGRSHVDATNVSPNSEVRNSDTYGVLKLWLYSDSYAWKFVPVAGKTFSDSGSATCHYAPSAGNHAPTAVAGGPYSGTEGTAMSFDGSGSSDPDGDALTYAWRFGDGSTGTGAKPSHTYANNGAYADTLTVTDARGAASAPATTSVTIANAPPAVNAGANQTVAPATSVTLNASFSDPGVNDAPWTYTIAWGDGSPQTTGSTSSQSSAVTATHTYAATGTDTVRVTVTDKDGAAGAGTLTVTVTAAVNRPPTAVAGGPYTGSEGAAVSFDGSGSSDPDGDALTYAWSFGDGSTGAGAKPSHTYANNGAYTDTLTVTDARGAASAPATTSVTIANAAPAVNTAASQTATAGTSFTLSATFSDPGVNDAPWSYSINWGDGSPQTTGSTSTQASAITATHTYAAAGTDTVRVTVTDKDGGSGSGKATVTVIAGNRPPTAAVGGPYSGSEGTAVSFDGGGSSDPDGDALTYAWSFGDGSTGTGAKPSHTYANNGSYTVTLTVTDARGAASAAATTTATIASVAPAVNAGANQTVTVGTSVALSASFSDPGVNDAPWAYAINWGDGSPQTTGSTISQSSALTATHTYAAAGSNTVRVTVTDRDGAAGSGQLTVTVTQPGASVTLVGAGQVARCDYTNDEATALLLDNIPGTVFTTGDNVRASGSLSDFTTCYDPSWGRHKARTRPSVGDLDYQTAGASGYFDYFGTTAGDRDKGYYSYELGDWHVIVLNSNIDMTAGSLQEQWLRADLAASMKRCTLAYWHHPRFSSYSTNVRSSVKPLWDDLYAARAEVVLNGHYRLYERFAPQTPDEVADPQNGIRQFTVGTGGHGIDTFGTPIANSEVRISGTFGVLQLTLADGSYSWQFIPVAGQAATDSGSGSCH